MPELRLKEIRLSGDPETYEAQLEEQLQAVLGEIKEECKSPRPKDTEFQICPFNEGWACDNDGKTVLLKYEPDGVRLTGGSLKCRAWLPGFGCTKLNAPNDAESQNVLKKKLARLREQCAFLRVKAGE